MIVFAVFPDGLSRELLNLTGTLPITYKGNTYNIPVEMWIMDTHPYNPPLCYVKPTADMRIKSPHRHVDQNGRIYLPYLTDWNHVSWMSLASPHQCDSSDRILLSFAGEVGSVRVLPRFSNDFQRGTASVREESITK